MTITFTELAGDIRVPTVAVETDLQSGRQALPGLGKKLLLLGYQTSGTAADGEVHQIFSDDQAIELWGKGSMLAVMAEAALRQASRLELYGMSYPEDGTSVTATGTVTLSGTATSVGLLEVYVAGKRFAVGIEVGDTATEIGDAIAAKINAHKNLPATAANVTGTVTMTARNAGLEGNTISLKSTITATGVTSTDSGVYLASGTLAGVPDTELALIEAQRFHIYCIGTDNSDALDDLQAHVEKQSGAIVQKWGMGIAATNTAPSTAQTLASGLDSYRMQIVNHQYSNEPIFEVAACFAAERSFIVNRNQTLNDHEMKGITPQFNETKWLTRAEEEACLANGVTPLRPLRNGSVQVVRSIHTRVTSPAFIDHNPMEISDYIDEDFITIFKSRYSDAALKVLSPAATRNVVTPERALLVLHERMRIWDTVLDYTQGAEQDIKDGKTKAEANASDSSRLDVAYPFRPVFGAHVIAVLKTFTTPDII